MKQKYSKLDNIGDYAFAVNEQPALARIPIEAVLDLYEEATECYVNRYAESAWSTHVHYPLFKLALPKRDEHLNMIRPISWYALDRIPGCPSGACYSIMNFATNLESLYNTVRLPVYSLTITTFTPPATSLTFAFTSIHRLSATTPMDDTVTRTRRNRPEQSINHTGYAPLRHRPIVLSAKSQEPGGKMLDAELQVGVWQAAHWSLLEELVGVREAEEREEKKKKKDAEELLIPRRTGTATTTTPEQLPKEPSPGLQKAAGGTSEGERDTTIDRQKLPDFLLALIIQGHDWHFVVTTRDAGSTVSFRSLPLSMVVSLGFSRIALISLYTPASLDEAAARLDRKCPWHLPDYLWAALPCTLGRGHVLALVRRRSPRH